MNGWDSGNAPTTEHDVRLPLDLAALVAARPTTDTPTPRRAAWLLWQASIYQRIATATAEHDHHACGLAGEESAAAEAAGVALLAEQFLAARQRITHHPEPVAPKGLAA